MTLKSDCIVSALQGFLSSYVLSYLCEMCAGDENHRLLLLSTTLQSCQHFVYRLEFSQYSVYRSQCLLPASSNVLLFAAYLFHHGLGIAYGINSSEDSKTQRQAFILLHVAFFICSHGTCSL